MLSRSHYLSGGGSFEPRREEALAPAEREESRGRVPAAAAAAPVAENEEEEVEEEGGREGRSDVRGRS
jgi:hypothetical protein